MSNQTPKRSAQNPLLANVTKTPKVYNTDSPNQKLITILNNKIQSQTEVIKNMIIESENRIRLDIDKKINEIRSEVDNLKEKVQRIESVSSEVSLINKDILEIKRKLLTQDNSVVASSLRVTGVPKLNNEDLAQLFKNLCENLNIATPRVTDIYRLEKIKNRKKSYVIDDVVVIKLHSPYEKNFVLKSISKFKREKNRHLSLFEIGIESDKPIYVNENLTPHNYGIFKSALKLKKQKMIHAAYTIRGLVYIKTFNSDVDQLIEFPDQLQQYFRNGNSYNVNCGPDPDAI